MNKQNLMIPAFIVMALVQLYIPVQMIWQRESVITEGKEFKFKTAPIDPNDPFRGKYVQLNFPNTMFAVDSAQDWQAGEKVFVSINEGSDGYAIISGVSRTAPDYTPYYFKSKVYYLSADFELSVEFPFERFYMEEYKAPKAEEAYFESARDTTFTTYALVSILNGETVLKNIMINDQTINDWLIDREASN
ncbi:MAG: GDYXXLXY domain-containing protein [Marinoscillum sp.]